MALPSSPPLLPDFEPPSSPPFPPQLALSRSYASRSRKRQFPASDSLSSDPIFSDDTTDADEPNANGNTRRKRLIRGPWWSLAQKESSQHVGKSNKTPAARNVDSGVWMWSDASDGSDDSINEQPASLDRSAKAPSDVRASHEELQLRRADDVVQRCVDTGAERIDLTNLGLGDHSSATLSRTLKPLQQLIRQSFNDLTQPPSEDTYVPLTPSLQLFLSGNRLTRLPSELFRLQNITVLSLRNNELTTLPHSICRLRRLSELNVAGNNISFLPWELLQLTCQRPPLHLTARPNPLLGTLDASAFADLHSRCGTRTFPARIDDPRAVYDRLKKPHAIDDSLAFCEDLDLRYQIAKALKDQCAEDCARLSPPADSMRLVSVEPCVSPSSLESYYLLSSPIQYFDIDGLLCDRSHTRPFPFANYRTTPTTEAPNSAPSAHAGAHVPSLFEQALRTVKYHLPLPADDNEPNTADFPPTVERALQTASFDLAHGSKRCSTCDRAFLIPRARWIEWWHCDDKETTKLLPNSILPFAREACSWGCAQPSRLGRHSPAPMCSIV